MTDLVLNSEQVKTIRNANLGVQVVDGEGNILGFVVNAFFSASEIAEMERAFDSDEPRYTTQEVLQHLRSLESR